MPDPISEDDLQDLTAISKIYQTLTDNETGANISAIMRKIQDVVDDSVKQMLETPGHDIGTIIDLSRLDFDLIRRMFEKSTTKNTEVQSLKQVIEQKLQSMIRQNPLRINFFERYQEIIEDYNSGKDSVTVQRTFEELMKMVQQMSAEERRVKMEGLSEEQAAVFDLLRKPQLSPADSKKVKEVAVDLLAELKKEPLVVENWSEKTATSAEVKNVINVFLYQHMPEAYTEKEIDIQVGSLLTHFKSSYFGGGASVYA